MDALGDFIQKVPTEVDDIVRDSLKPLLYYARKRYETLSNC